ncbi:hypothetical protein M5689_006785 [Euphorbia peplus]|nr:hypothetical protein M5689_006785 [Euphorbia peplus]
MLYRCESETEFDDVWNVICNSFEQVKTHPWLSRLYGLRQKWCKGLNKDFFSAGLSSSQRSEITNQVLKTIGNKTISITKFVLELEAIVARWRSSEFEEDFRCKQCTPSHLLKTSGLLNHAASDYTCEIYKHFEKEFWQVMATDSIEIACSGDTRLYEVKGEARDSRKCVIRFNTSSMSISCTCKKIESKGMICFHILRVLSINNVKKIPESCLLHRSTRDAKKGLCVDMQGGVSREVTNETGSMFRNKTMRRVYDIVTRSEESEICRQICKNTVNKLIVEIERQLSALNVEEGCDVEEHETSTVKGKQKVTDVEPILNPPRAKPKGTSNARFKGHFEIGKAKGNKTRLEKGVFLKILLLLSMIIYKNHV